MTTRSLLKIQRAFPGRDHARRFHALCLGMAALCSVLSLTGTGDLIAKSPPSLAEGISDEGPKAGTNAEVLASLGPLARKFQASGDAEIGREVILRIDRLLEAAEKWPVTDRVRGVLSNEVPDRHGEYGAYWTTWYHYDPEAVAKVAEAYALVRDSKLFRDQDTRERGALRRRIEDRLAAWWKMYSVTWPWQYTNPDGFRLFGMAKLALALGKPEWVHQVLRWTDRYLTATMRRDGLWYENTPSYHRMAYRKFPELFKILRGYSDPSGYRDPVDGTHITNFDPLARWGRWQRMHDAALATLLLPDGWPLVLNDAHYARRGEMDGPPPRPPENPAASRLLPETGVAMLGCPTGDGPFQVWLNFETPSGHDHWDGLGIVLYAHGQEILSEGDYVWTPLGAREDKDLRRWTMETAAHNTVVVDEHSQIGRGGGVSLKTRWGDPAIPDWQWPAMQSHPGNHPNLLVYDVLNPAGQVVSAEARALYPRTSSKYQRTLILLGDTSGAPRVFDIFDIVGGNTHDWMVHGPLQSAYTMKSSLPLAPQEGTIARHIRDLQASGETADAFSLVIQDERGIGDLLAFPAQGKPVTLTLGEGPAMRRAGTAPYARIRQSGPVSRFAVAHFPFRDGQVPSPEVRAVAYNSDGSIPVAWEITQGDGARDYVFLPPPSGPHRLEPVHFEGLSVQGEFAWIRLGADGKLVGGLLIGDGVLKVGEAEYPAQGGAEGDVVGVSCEEQGEGVEGFVDVTAALPQGGVLAGQTLYVLAGDGTRHACRIARVEAQKSGSEHPVSRVYLRDNPGFRLTEDGLEWVFFPTREVPGTVQFHLPARWSLAP